MYIYIYQSVSQICFYLTWLPLGMGTHAWSNPGSHGACGFLAIVVFLGDAAVYKAKWLQDNTMWKRSFLTVFCLHMSKGYKRYKPHFLNTQFHDNEGTPPSLWDLQIVPQKLCNQTGMQKCGVTLVRCLFSQALNCF